MKIVLIRMLNQENGPNDCQETSLLGSMEAMHSK